MRNLCQSDLTEIFYSHDLVEKTDKNGNFPVRIFIDRSRFCVTINVFRLMMYSLVWQHDCMILEYYCLRGCRGGYMEKFVSVIYGFLANILIYIAGFPGNIVSSGSGVWLGVAFLWGLLSIMLFFRAVKRNNGSYQFLVKLAIGAACILIVIHFAVIKLSGLNETQIVSKYEFGAAAGCLILAVIFVIVNFLLDFGKGKITVMLWFGEFLFASSVLTLWDFIKGTGSAPQYDKLMLVSRVVEPFTSLLDKLGFPGITGFLESIILILLMFVTVYYLFQTRRFISDEWIACVAGQIMAGTAYLIYEVHDGIAWRMDQAFMVFLLFCAGWIINIAVFIYEITLKDQNGCIGAVFLGISGTLWSFAVVFSVDMAKRGALGKNLDRISGMMTKIYRFVPFGRHTDFSKGNVLLPVLGAIITLVLTILIIVLLFLILGKILNYAETGAGMSAVWFRNCSIVLIIPITIYWICSMYGNIFGDSYSWINLMIQSLTGIGIALCISNVAPAIRKGFLGQLKLILISTLSALIASTLLVPAILAFI